MKNETKILSPNINISLFECFKYAPIKKLPFFFFFNFLYLFFKITFSNPLSRCNIHPILIWLDTSVGTLPDVIHCREGQGKTSVDCFYLLDLLSCCQIHSHLTYFHIPEGDAAFFSSVVNWIPNSFLYTINTHYIRYKILAAPTWCATWAIQHHLRLKKKTKTDSNKCLRGNFQLLTCHMFKTLRCNFFFIK